SPHHLDLHSFPTRRSSDLLRPVSIISASGYCSAIAETESSFEPLSTNIILVWIPFCACTLSRQARVSFLPFQLRTITATCIILLDRKSTRLNSSHVAIAYA